LRCGSLPALRGRFPALRRRARRSSGAWRGRIIQALLAGLRLTLHERQAHRAIPTAEGIPFLGFVRLSPTTACSSGATALPSRRHLRIAYRAVDAGALSHDDLRRRIKGWIAHASHGDTWRLRRSLLAVPVPRRSP
jgi:RNA-directed DNA polymerase